jgi:hypothetical protein
MILTVIAGRIVGFIPAYISAKVEGTTWNDARGRMHAILPCEALLCALSRCAPLALPELLPDDFRA